MNNVYFNYQKIVTYFQARFGLAYPVPSFQKWLASTNSANVVNTNNKQQRTADQTEKIPQLQKVLMKYKQLKAEWSGTMCKHLR